VRAAFRALRFPATSVLTVSRSYFRAPRVALCRTWTT